MLLTDSRTAASFDFLHKESTGGALPVCFIGMRELSPHLGAHPLWNFGG